VGEQTYTVTFQSVKADWPEGFSQDVGFGGMVGCSHGDDYTLVNKLNSWNPGYKPIMASPGLIDLAEDGTTDTLMQEFADAFDVLNTAESSALESGDGEMKMTLTLDASHTKISWAAKITPSPDWFIGGYIDLCPDGYWATNSRQIYVTDAGSDSGSQEAMEVKSCNEESLCDGDDIVRMGIATYDNEPKDDSGCSVLSSIAAVLVALAAAVFA